MEIKHLAEMIEKEVNKNKLILFLAKKRKLDEESYQLYKQNQDVFNVISRISRITKALEDPTVDINGDKGMMMVAQAIQDLTNYYLNK